MRTPKKLERLGRCSMDGSAPCMVPDTLCTDLSSISQKRRSGPVIRQHHWRWERIFVGIRKRPDVNDDGGRADPVHVIQEGIPS
jgi:hypothetical protein